MNPRQQITMPTAQSEQHARNFQKKVIHHGPYSLYPVSQGIFDIFLGIGFGGHSRYRKHKGQWIWLSGTRLDTAGLPNANA